MRFIFKTNYEQDIASPSMAGRCSGTAAAAAAAGPPPWLVPEYWLAQLTFVRIYGIVGLG